MKRSSQITLVLLTSMSALALTGCDDGPVAKPDNGGTFANKAECVAVYDQKTCDAAEKLAQSEHEKNAPKSTREKCILDYGPDMCQPAHDNSGMFMPMMVGYMMGSAMSQPAPLYYGPGAYRHYGQSGYNAPIYSSGSGYRNTGAIGNAPYVSKSTPTTKGSLKGSTSLTPATTQRGGFGSSFKPTTSFKQSYATANPESFGKSGYSRSTGAVSSRAMASARSSYSSGSTSRGGFGSSGRGFSGGG